MYRKIFFLLTLQYFLMSTYGENFSADSLSKYPVYTSLEVALREPEKVYRLHIKWTRMDSLPEAIFILHNLRELHVSNCKLLILNKNIHKLENLQYLVLYKNRLVILPDEICNMTQLRYLDVSRNLIYALPDNIGQLNNLREINAWGNYLLELPESIRLLANTLKKIDLRQIAFRREEIEVIERQLPKTEILYTNICDCKNSRK